MGIQNKGFLDQDPTSGCEWAVNNWVVGDLQLLVADVEAWWPPIYQVVRRTLNTGIAIMVKGVSRTPVRILGRWAGVWQGRIRNRPG